MNEELAFGDTVIVDDEPYTDCTVIGMSLTEITVVSKIEHDDQYFGYTIRRVPHNRVQLA